LIPNPLSTVDGGHIFDAMAGGAAVEASDAGSMIGGVLLYGVSRLLFESWGQRLIAYYGATDRWNDVVQWFQSGWGIIFVLLACITTGLFRVASLGAGFAAMNPLLFVIVLTLSLVQILLLSLVLILVPLWMRNRMTTAQPGRLGVFLYFAALGLGFMFIEIALLQKLSVFVGGPMYSMAITLASILIYSGLGSYVGRKFENNLGRCLAMVIVIIVAVIGGEIYFLNRILPALMGLRLEVRWVVASIAVLPVAFLLGMPLPTGLRILQQIDPVVRPWAWGINAFATVIGGIMCVLLSIEKGFTVTLLAAAALYLLGGIALGWSVRRSRFAARAGEPVVQHAAT